MGEEMREILDRVQELLIQNSNLKDLLRRTSATLHQVSEDSIGVFHYAQVHGMEYDGAQYGEILKEIDALLGIKEESNDG
jgi:hypothetical protein